MTDKTMSVEVRLKNTSQPLIFEAKNTYEKGSFFCMYLTTNKVKKIPTADIFDVTESYACD